MKLWQISLTVVLALLVTAAPVLAQSTAPGSSPSPSAPSVAPSTPGDVTKPTTPTTPTTPSTRMPGTSAPSASPSTTGPVPAMKSDCAGGGWSKFSAQGFTNEAECLGWLDKQGK